jgi:hypothetical protein
MNSKGTPCQSDRTIAAIAAADPALDFMTVGQMVGNTTTSTTTTLVGIGDLSLLISLASQQAASSTDKKDDAVTD